jgi:hypothetical protein
MVRRQNPVIFASVAVIATPTMAFAGMPVVFVNDVGTMRLETLSFFIMMFFVSSWIIQRLWNGLSRDFPRLPRLGYWRAVSLVAVWGLLFLVVLTMISGARELLTPGAWEKVGLTYKLADSNAEPSAHAITTALRREKLERLRSALWAYAAAHTGKLPTGPTDPDIAAEFWQTPDRSGVQYGYVADLTIHLGARPLAFEPSVFDAEPWVLFTSGEVRSMPVAELDKLLASGGGPP